jgi:hypothetical protein
MATFFSHPVQVSTATRWDSIADFSIFKTALPRLNPPGKVVDLLWQQDSCIFISAGQTVPA